MILFSIYSLKNDIVQYINRGVASNLAVRIDHSFCSYIHFRSGFQTEKLLGNLMWLIVKEPK